MNIATSKSGKTYFISGTDETFMGGSAWGLAIRDGKRYGAMRRMKLANLTFVGTATMDADGAVHYVTAPKASRSLAFAMEMPALNGDVVTQGHADYCAENGHATHTTGDDVSPWCPRCGHSISEGRETGGIIAALPSANDRAAAAKSTKITFQQANTESGEHDVKSPRPFPVTVDAETFELDAAPLDAVKLLGFQEGRINRIVVFAAEFAKNPELALNRCPVYLDGKGGFFAIALPVNSVTIHPAR